MDGGWEHAEFRKDCSASCFSTLGKTRCVAIVAPPAHTFSFHGLTVCVCMTSTFLLLARLLNSAMVQRCSLCCVFRVGVVNVSPLRRRMVVVVSARGTCLVHLVILQSVARQSRGLLHMVCLSVPPKRVFVSLRLCVLYAQINNNRNRF